MKFQKALLLVWCTAASLALSQRSPDIHLNQIGFYPTMSKIAIVRGVGNAPFVMVSGTDTVFRGTLSSLQRWQYSGEDVSVADFSACRKSGTYVVSIPGVGESSPFEIKEHVFENVAQGVAKAFYYQRASTALTEEYAGVWARPAGHPDTAVFVHPSAATAVRPGGSVISSPGGWYDAGDYNKYIVNSGISTYTLLATYEDFPTYCSALDLNIPESTNDLPDILDEALWNVRWMLTMQDPTDGGVYHKLTNESFDPFVMPHQATSPRYVVMKTTAAALNFAAVMAQMSRIAKQFPTVLQGFADTCLTAALKAWQWARQHPAVYYHQREMNAQYDPDIRTGEYGDSDLTDEFAWAAGELFVTTQRDSFFTVARPLLGTKPSLPSWRNVRMLPFYTFARYRHQLASVLDSQEVCSNILSLANSYLSAQKNSAYKIVMGVEDDFFWGSNGVAANQGVLLLAAFRLTGDTAYLTAALSNVDYLLGRNPLNISFVTGYGSWTPRNIHHRIPSADTIPEPMPGFLVGGPNQKKEDRLHYPSSFPALSYLDTVASYASNEVAINWNAPLAYLLIGLEAILSPDGQTVLFQRKRSSSP